MPFWPASTPSSAHEASVLKRDRFTPDELAGVLGHYSVGAVDSAQEFDRGSRRSPKLVIATSSDKYLLRNARAEKQTKIGSRVTFSHAIQVHLSGKHFPLPRLIPTTE